MQVLTVILLMFFMGCETDPFRDQKRRSSKYKIAALIGHYTQTISTVQVDKTTYDSYNVGDTYSKGTINYKYIENEYYFFVIAKIARDEKQ